MDEDQKEKRFFSILKSESENVPGDFVEKVMNKVRLRRLGVVNLWPNGWGWWGPSFGLAAAAVLLILTIPDNPSRVSMDDLLNGTETYTMSTIMDELIEE